MNILDISNNFFTITNGNYNNEKEHDKNNLDLTIFDEKNTMKMN